jgi:hypothetical protein
MMPHRAILRTAALVVPRRKRAEWLAEWRAELWYVERRSSRRAAVRFTLGAFRDAFWLRRSCPHRNVESAEACLVLLGLAAAAAIFSFMRWPPRLSGPPLAYVLMLAVALAILPATLPLTFGEYPRTARLKRWGFAALKMALIATIVFCATRGLEPHGTLAGYVAGFRWALLDQRRRCPVCLRRLANPTRIGGPARTFLEWYGTELFCTRGHGLMHIPEVAASYSAPRWQALDASWSSLFL